LRTIQNTYIGFRCPNTLKEKIEQFAIENDLHVSQVIRNAVSSVVRQNPADIKNIQNRPTKWTIAS
jgi:hypothetical protein